MKFTRLKLKNYTRIFNGLELNEINIDFTKCKNNIVMINGRNGRGKTTILDALTFFPEAPSEILDNHEGGKYISAIVEGGDLYEGNIIYPIENNGKRGKTKASIKKNGEELNPNGNVSSYKEIIESEFNIDMNFLSLSYLSSMDRGLSDKRPAERKSYVNSALASVDTYNNIHKTLSKKANIFKSHITSLSSKIQMIGDMNSIEVQMKGIQQRISQLEKEKALIEKAIHKLEAGIEIMDPDSRIQNTYNEIASNIGYFNENLYNWKMDLEKMYKDYDFLNPTDGNLLELIAKEETLHETNINLRFEMNNKLKEISDELSSLYDELKQYKAKKDSLDLNTNVVTLKASIAQYTDLIRQQEEAFNKLDINDFNITKEETQLNFEILKSIESMIDNLYSVHYMENISMVCQNWGYYNTETYQAISTQVNQQNITINDLNNIISYYLELVDEAKLLDNRPNGCKEDGCFFIKKAMEAKKLNPELQLQEYEEKLKYAENKLKNMNKELEDFSTCLSIKRDIELILSLIHKHKITLAKFRTTGLLLDDDTFLSALATGKQFKLSINSNIYNKYISLLDGYENNKQILLELKEKHSELAGKDEIVEMIDSNMKRLYDRIESLNNETDILYNQIKLKDEIIAEEEKKMNVYKEALFTRNTIGEMEQKKAEMAKKFSDIKDNISKIDENLKAITEYKSQLNALMAELTPLQTEYEKVKYDMILLQEYNAEYEEYNKKYEVINLLKKYSSPTNGIQTLYMKLYMDKTLRITNDLLQLFFDGEIQLSEYVINESEFRIPCMINGLSRDDISSCSNAQTSMLSMILSCSLMSQASDIYNVIRLDEIDGSLDQYNRYAFVNTLQKLMRVLGIEQVFIISHSSELESISVDNVCLSGTEGIFGNIIFNSEDLIMT